MYSWSKLKKLKVITGSENEQVDLSNRISAPGNIGNSLKEILNVLKIFTEIKE